MKRIQLRVEGVIFNKEGDILLALHQKKNKSYWVLPGGHLEFAEKLEEALKRELQEELGLMSTAVKELLSLDEFINPEEERHIVKVSFLVECPQEDLLDIKVLSKVEAIKEARFFSLESLAQSQDIFYPSKDFYIKLLGRHYG
jgi:8-oxo-dGTP diphosphatase